MRPRSANQAPRAPMPIPMKSQSCAIPVSPSEAGQTSVRGRVDGMNGFLTAGVVCGPMAADPWTRERVVGAIRRWHEVRGVAPRKRDWNKAGFDPSGAPVTPAADVVLELFGKWSEAVKAA